MLFRGTLIAESPIFRGNARKTLFTRDGDGTQRLISLAGEISGTAQALMDAFIGQSRDGRNIGLLNRLWQRLYDSPLPEGLITRVECQLQDAAYPQDHFFDLRMGLRLDEDRWAAEANANYKMETLFRNAAFDFTMMVNDAVLQRGDNVTRLYYVLQELRAGRFWFGAGKSKGLGRVRLELDLPPAPPSVPQIHPEVNYLKIVFRFNAANPVLVGWNWGKVDPEVPAFAAIEGRLLVAAMRDIPDPIRQRLEMVIGGPILSPEDWKKKFAEYLPRTIALWLQERSAGTTEVWILREKALTKLTKGKYPLSQKVAGVVKPLCEQPFSGQAQAEAALKEALGEKAANQAKRLLEVMERQQQASQQLNHEAWLEVADSLGLDADLESQLSAQLGDEAAMTGTLAGTCAVVLPRLYQQVDQQIDLLRSDAWVDAELATREAHLRIKTLLLEGKISEAQWGDRSRPPEGVSAAAWRSFLEEHSRVRYQHIVHPVNLRKSITNDRNFIAFLKGYRARARQELSQPQHVDFRAGGPFNREISRKYGKPYDTMFMRMLTWSPSAEQEGAWEIYIPGSTIKGAFRKRASQVLKTIWGDSPRTAQVLDYLFGVQGRRGAISFSDAYLADSMQPEKVWCSMDGVRMDPATARPIETAKRDYLFAYGDQLTFQLQLELQDIAEEDLPALGVLVHLLQDFQGGDIPLGGEKTSGFGWVNAEITELTWLTASATGGLTARLFGDQALVRDGIWHRLSLKGEAAAKGLRWSASLAAAKKPVPLRGSSSAVPTLPRAQAGFVSHRAFGGYCGTLAVEAEVLTPLHVRESGEPSHKVVLPEGNVNGWDCFAMAPAEAALRPETKLYALPSRSLKGMLRHIYAIASDSKSPSPDIGRLNPVDSLFGWVGTGPNQALMGRLAFSFAPFEGTPELAWFKVPYPYGGWVCTDGRWQKTATKSVPMFQIAKTWRLFYHAPLAPIVQRLADFRPDAVQASYTRAILPGAKARFGIRFWNLEKEELQRLIWCVGLEDGLAHKLGHHRYVGFGSLRLRVLPQSTLIDWSLRYAGQPEADWRVLLKVEEWLDPKAIAYYPELQRALDARSL
jgi:CRISPR/Cas system CSM-associated protein Csm3 (group 7 of RAMP superfamily)